MDLKLYGWNNFFENKFMTISKEGHIVGRVVAEYGSHYRLVTEHAEINAEVSGKFRFTIEENGSYPAVGDWVVVEPQLEENKGIIQAVLPRRSKFSRKAAGKETIEQVAAANFDYVFIVCSLNSNYNLRRIERYLVLAWDSGAIPVIILSKADLCSDKDLKVVEVQAVAPGVDVYAISATNNTGLDALKNYLISGKTVVLLGSSGVGKSTIVNSLAGKELLKVQAVREDDDRGRHTTTHREMVLLPNNAMIIDNPGIREIALWDSNEGLSDAFDDIELFAKDCRFSDCSHITEPNCAVKEAIQDGRLDSKRFESYLKLKKESVFIESKQNERIKLEQKKKAKELSVLVKNHKKRPNLYED